MHLVAELRRRQHKRALQPKRDFGKNLQATGGIGSIYIPCPHGLRLMLGGNITANRGVVSCNVSEPLVIVKIGEQSMKISMK